MDKESGLWEAVSDRRYTSWSTTKKNRRSETASHIPDLKHAVKSMNDYIDFDG
jgi:hypothetical protein